MSKEIGYRTEEIYKKVSEKLAQFLGTTNGEMIKETLIEEGIAKQNGIRT